MTIKIKPDSLIFKGLNEDQEKQLLKCSSGLIVKADKGDFVVKGSYMLLYGMLYELSKVYDLEVI